jgi:hypothetical protein
MASGTDNVRVGQNSVNVENGEDELSAMFVFE